MPKPPLRRHASKLPLRRRAVILAGLMACLTSAHGAAVPTAEPGGEILELWPGGAPGSARVRVREELIERSPQGPLRDRIAQHVTRPLLTLFRPREPNGITLLIIPGGGYIRVVIDKEGFESARWLAERGFTAAVLRYRLPADGWAAGPDAPVHDAMRAMRLLRASNAADGAQRVGVLGFSAGGHVAARLITGRGLAYTRVDSTDDASAHPDFAVLMYPVITMQGESAHAGSRQQLIAAGVSADALPNYSPELQVSASTSPTLLMHAADDDAVPVANSVLMYDALRQSRVAVELHVFERGGHGFGLRGAVSGTLATWPLLVQAWALRHAQARP